MRFWHKIFLLVIVVFLISFDVTAFMIINKSYNLVKQNDIERTLNETRIILKSVEDRISKVEKYYTELNTDNMQMYISPYGEYYKNQGVYLMIRKDDEILYSNFKEELPNIEKSSIEFNTINDTPYMFISIPFSDQSLTFTYIKDETILSDYRNEMSMYTFIISIIVSVCLSAIVIIMIIKLTKPIEDLNKTAKHISKGNYTERAEIKSKDEIGEFAQSFNTMTESIELHIKELSELTENKQRFIDDLSHELRTPIASIMGYSEFIKNANCTDTQKSKAIDYIYSESNRIQKLSEKLMILTSLKNDDLQIQEIDLHSLVNTVLQTLHSKISEKEIEAVTDLNVASVESDTVLLESLIQNILENAVKYSPHSGKIVIKSYAKDDLLFVTISDNGTGINKNELQKIKEPFYKTDKSRSTKSGGVGLGLSICEKICEKLGINMKINSKINEGTEIVLEFTTV